MSSRPASKAATPSPLVHANIDDQDAAQVTFGEETVRREGEIVEYAIARAGVVQDVVAAGRRVDGKAMFKCQLCGEPGAARREPRTRRQQRRDRKADPPPLIGRNRSLSGGTAVARTSATEAGSSTASSQACGMGWGGGASAECRGRLLPRSAGCICWPGDRRTEAAGSDSRDGERGGGAAIWPIGLRRSAALLELAHRLAKA
jgi:hypothetical protein